MIYDKCSLDVAQLELLNDIDFNMTDYVFRLPKIGKMSYLACYELIPRIIIGTGHSCNKVA